MGVWRRYVLCQVVCMYVGNSSSFTSLHFFPFTSHHYVQSAIKFLTEKFFNARKKGKIDDVFINFVSKEQSITYMVNNIAGILKNVLYLKKHELVERRRRIEQDRAERLANRSLLARSISVKSTSSLRKLLAEADTQPLSSTPSDSPPLSSPSPSRKISMLARKASVYRKRETDT